MKTKKIEAKTKQERCRFRHALIEINHGESCCTVDGLEVAKMVSSEQCEQCERFESMFNEKITVYTDGSALNNGSPDSGCGWACKLIYRGHEKMKSGSDKGKTNNVMEMTAVLEAMKAITDKSIPVEVFSDSKYVVETMNGYYKVKKNVDLWKELLAEKEKFAEIKFIWVKGHDKNRHNNEVDRAAAEEARKIQ